MSKINEEYAMEEWEDEGDLHPDDAWMKHTVTLDALERHCHARTLHEWLTPEDPALVALVEVALGLWNGDPVDARNWLLLRVDQLRAPVTRH